MHEPRNRLDETLEILRIEIVHAKGTQKTCPNGLAIFAGFTGNLDDVPSPMAGLMPWSTPFRIMDLQPLPTAVSILSGAPAVLYRVDDLEIPLTPEEVRRLARRSLRPHEVLKLLEHFGSFHEIHDDFYDPETGEAFQPMDEDEEPAPASAALH